MKPLTTRRVAFTQDLCHRYIDGPRGRPLAARGGGDMRCTSNVTFFALMLIARGVDAVTIDWVTIGDPGNSADSNGYGSVPYTYQISRYEVTSSQYVEFLNAAGTVETSSSSWALYSSAMATVSGIVQTGFDSDYSRPIYSVLPGFENKPVGSVKFYAALRFANWLNNGQPAYADHGWNGSYTITGETIADNSVGRNSGANIVIPNRDEWLKAAKYDPVAEAWFLHPTGSDMAPSCVTPAEDTGNSLNCTTSFTDIGAYTLSASPYGTFDQAGNAAEWFDDVTGGCRLTYGSFFASCTNSSGGIIQGFRVANVPEPSTAALLSCGLLMMSLRRRVARV